MICAWLHLHLSVRAGDGSRHSEGIVKHLELRLWMPLLYHCYYCCDWLRYQVWSATPVSVYTWEHLQLSDEIRPWDTLKPFAAKKQTSCTAILRCRAGISSSWFLLNICRCFAYVNLWKIRDHTSPFFICSLNSRHIASFSCSFFSHGL